jgi:hypothetical protein
LKHGIAQFDIKPAGELFASGSLVFRARPRHGKSGSNQQTEVILHCLGLTIRKIDDSLDYLLGRHRIGHARKGSGFELLGQTSSGSEPANKLESGFRESIDTALVGRNRAHDVAVSASDQGTAIHVGQQLVPIRHTRARLRLPLQSRVPGPEGVEIVIARGLLMPRADL